MLVCNLPIRLDLKQAPVYSTVNGGIRCCANDFRFWSRAKTIIKMERQQNLVHFSMYLNDLYAMIKYVHEHRDVLHLPVEEMMQLAENLERHVNCSRQVNDEVINSSLPRPRCDTFDEMKEFRKKRLALHVKQCSVYLAISNEPI